MDLKALRDQLDAVDARFIELAAERQRVVGEIGRFKRSQGRQVRDFAREREVLERAAGNARAAGLDPALGQELLRQLIEASLAAQEAERVRAEGEGSGKSALVSGGGGRMGQWFARFLDSQGFAVAVADPAGCPDAFPQVTDWRELDLVHDLVVVAAPLRSSAAILHELAARRPRGVVFDIGSLKSPLAAGLRALRAAGVRTTSVHPMFGPSVNVLAGRHVIFIDLGDEEANAAARALFAQTMAVPVSMDLDQHDRLMGYVLGLSHALNITFFTALAESHEMAETLNRASSTTFDRQLAIARGLAAENPHLYYEIQWLNEHGGGALAALESALGKVLGTIRGGDEAAFVRLMETGRAYLERRDAAPR
ncbi:MAG: prephenate dehydrogenase/arogenate dehydrogenase family protein [Pseudomonadota bacterium]